MTRKVSGTVLVVLGSLGSSANLLVVVILLLSSPAGLGLVVHQCLVDCARAAILFPLGNNSPAYLGAYLGGYLGGYLGKQFPPKMPQIILQRAEVFAVNGILFGMKDYPTFNATIGVGYYS